jgi:hypothetical protein
MKTILRLLAAPALVVGLGLALSAEDAPPARSTGRVLLLRSERALEGEIVLVGGQYRIRRGAAEVWIASAQVVRLCADWPEAYEYMKTRANLGDPDERLRLARWCQLNHLETQALAEARMVLQMRPGQAQARQIVALLERRLSDGRPAHAVVPAAAPAAPAPAPDVDLSPESLIAFKTRVQPILVNACMSCHTGAQAGPFRLYRVTEGGLHSSTRRNLAAVLAEVNLEQIAVSPLLVKTLSPHGGAKQWPIKNRDALAYQALHGWLEQTAATNPHLRVARSTAPAPARLPSRLATAAEPLAAPPAVEQASGIVSRPLDRSEVERPQPPPVQITQPATGPEDEYAPAQFNEQRAPKK